MDEVKGFLDGNWNYLELRGPTGPIVYPAGFVYIFSVLYFITGKGSNVRLAQYIFGGFYVILTAVVFYIYSQVKIPLGTSKTKKVMKVSGLFVFFLCLSKRIHSIFVLRLFNDSMGMFFVYFSILCMFSNSWSFAMLFYGIGLSIKMNSILFLPGLLVLLVKKFNIFGMLKKVSIVILVQLVVAIPFMIENASGYFGKSFEFDRKFFHIWTVNFKFLPESIFLSDKLDKLLLLCTISVMFLFAWFKWTRYDRIIQDNQKSNNIFVQFYRVVLLVLGLDKPKQQKLRRKTMTNEHIMTVLFTSNFIGIAFSRTLHFQFYVWYFHTIPYLLASTRFGWVVKLIVFFTIEFVFDVYPSNFYSSLSLTIAHMLLLVGLFFGRNYNPYVKKSLR